MPEVTLRPSTPTDLLSLTGDETEFNDFGPGQPRGSASARLDDNGQLSIEADGELAGQVSWRWEHWGPGAWSRCPELGIWLIPGCRGRGIGSVAQRQVAELFFIHTTANRVQASTDVENHAEQRALERAGFTREGVLRGAQWRRSAHHDIVLYAIVRADVG